MINYAHRGASTYYPENTLSSFFAGVDMKADGIETDIHRTKDGVLVLFHDDDIKRVTDGEGNVWDYTYEELLKFTVRNDSTGRTDKIAAFEDFLKYFGFRDLTFAIELKQDYVEKETIDMLERFGLREKTILTSFNFDNLVRAREYNPSYRIGYLYTPEEKDPVGRMKAIGGEQLCPKACLITPEYVKALHGEGFDVRAWGVSDEEIMRSVCLAGADGMTVNFPDRLTEYLCGAG